MTLEKDSFEGQMGSLNLDSREFGDYRIDDDLNYHQLTIIKPDIENQLTKLFDLLTNKFNVTMDTSLLTNDGFPRDDIDVVSIRLIRVKIIRLRNDHSKLLSLLEAKLIDQFNNTTANQANNTVVYNEQESIHKLLEANISFAQVTEIVEQSPASSAGLQIGDKIVLFDKNIHAGNHNKLVAVINRVKDSIDKPLMVHINRNGDINSLELIPTNNWPGNGVLGCKIVPL